MFLYCKSRICSKITSNFTKLFFNRYIIPFNPDAEKNADGIRAFMDKYVTRPYALGDNTVGVEVNFNKEFYVPETVESVEAILAEIAEIDSDLAKLQSELGL